MSLTSLPQDSIAHIASLLNSTDRQALAQTLSVVVDLDNNNNNSDPHCPTPSSCFSPGNHDFWHDVLARRFKRRPAHAHRNHPLLSRFLSSPSVLQHSSQHNPNIAQQQPVAADAAFETKPQMQMHAVVRLHDLVDDYLLRDGNDVCVQTVVSPTTLTLTPIPTTSPPTPRHHHHLANVDVRRSSRQQQQQQQYLTAMTAKSAPSAAAVALTVVDNRSHMIHAAYGKTVQSLYVGSALNSKDHHDDELDNDGDYDDDDEDNDGGSNNNNNSRAHNGNNRGRGRRRQRIPGRISVHLTSELNLDVDVTAMHVAEGVVAAGLVNGHVILHDVYNNNNRNNSSILNNHSRSSSFSPSKSLTTHHHPPPKKMRGHSSPVTAVHVDASRRFVASASHDCTVKLRRYNFQQHHSSSSSSSSSSSLSSSFSSSSLRGHGTPVRWIGQVTGSCYATHGGSAGDGRLKLWDVETGVCTSTVKLPHAIDVAHIHSPFLPSSPSAAVSTVRGSGGGSNDGADIYVAAGPSVHVVDPRVPGGVACILSAPRAWASGLDRLGDMTVDPHDGTVAAAVGEGGVILWDGRGSWEGRGIGHLHLHHHHHSHHHHRRWTSSSSPSSFRDRQLSSVALVQRSAVIATAAAPHVNDVLTFARDGSHTGALFVKDESWRAMRRRMLRRRRRRTDPSAITTSATPTIAASRRSGGGGGGVALNSNNAHDDEEVQALQAAIVNVQTVDVGVYDDVAVVVTRRNGVVTLVDVANSPVDWDAAVDTFVDLSCTERDRDRDREGGEALLTSTSSSGVELEVLSTSQRIVDRADVHAYAREQSTRFWNGAAYLAQQEQQQTNEHTNEET